MPSSSQCSRSGNQTYVSLFDNCASNSIWNDYSADRKRVRRVIIVYLLGKDTRQQLRSLPQFVLNTVIMRDIVTSWPNTRTAFRFCSTTRGSWTWSPSPASPPSSSSSTSTTGSSPTTPPPPPVALDRKLKARLKSMIRKYFETFQSMDTMDKHLTIKARGRKQSRFNVALKVSKIALCAFYAA